LAPSNAIGDSIWMICGCLELATEQISNIGRQFSEINTKAEMKLAKLKKSKYKYKDAYQKFKEGLMPL